MFWFTWVGKTSWQLHRERRERGRSKNKEESFFPFWSVTSACKKGEGKRIKGEGFGFSFSVTAHLVRKETDVHFYFCQVHIKGNNRMCKKGIFKIEVYVIFFWYKPVHSLCVPLSCISEC